MNEKRYKILLADDDPLSLIVLENALTDQYNLAFAETGEEVLHQVEKEAPDLILLDIMMPEIDGYEVCRRLKKDPQSSEIPVIFITALVEDKNEYLGFDVGGVDYITKPVSALLVRARVRSHLALSEQRQTLKKNLNHRTTELRNAENIEARVRRFSHIFEESLSEIYLFDATTLKFTEVNETAQRNIGYSSEEFQHLTPLDLKPELSAEGFAKLLAPLRSGEVQKIHFETVHQRKDKTFYEVEVHLQLFCYEDEPIFVSMILDITERRKVEAQKRENEKHLHTLINTIPDLVWLKDPEGVYVFCNERFEGLFGSKEADIIGKTDYDFVDKELADFFRVNDLRAAAAGGPSKNEQELIFANDGHKEVVEAIKTPIYNEDGSLCGVLGVARDITERKQTAAKLRKEKDYSEQMINALPGLFYQIDSDGAFVKWNSNFETVSGYSASEMGELSPLDLFMGEDKKAIGQSIREVFSTGFANVDANFLTKDKRLLPYYFTGKRVYIDTTPSIIGMGVDVSKLKEAEENIQILNRDLEQRVEQRTAELRTARDRAEDGTRTKSEFLANMSHEIRTPMNAIMGMTHLALETTLSSQQKDYLKTIELSSHSLLRVINDILDFSKIEADKLEIESVEFDLNHVIEVTKNNVSLMTQKKGLELIVDIEAELPERLIGDAVRLGQVLTNLTNNGVKFTDKGELIISIKKLLETPDIMRLQFSVSDTGIGMNSKQQKALFRAFSQGDSSTTRKYGGTGLGLTISKRLVEMMNGEIWVESVEGEGSHFYFTAEFGTVEKTERKGAIVPVELQDISVLVVDDNPKTLTIMARLLETLSFSVAQALSGRQALQMLKEAELEQSPFSLVIVDWKMPKMDGFQFGQLVRQQYQENCPKMIMVTGFYHDDSLLENELSRFDTILHKPIFLSQLYNGIVEVFCGDIDERLPLSSTSEITSQQHRHFNNTAILLVEDNKINQQIAKELLSKTKVDLTIAGNGLMAVKLCEKRDFGLILMDIQMPIMDGLMATREIRKLPSYSIDNIPIIAMTAHAMGGDKEKSIQAGMNDHLTKPIDPEKLYSCLEQWLSSTGMETDELTVECETTAGSSLPEKNSGIDRADGLKRVAGNWTLYQNILKDFQSENENFADEIGKMLRIGDLSRAERLVHTLRGVSGNIGAKELQKRAHLLELAITEESEHIESLVEETVTSLAVVMGGLGELLIEKQGAKMPTLPGNDAGVTAIAPQLVELKQLLTVGDMGAEDVFLDIREELIVFDSELASRLSNALDFLDFKKALKILEAIDTSSI